MADAVPGRRLWRVGAIAHAEAAPVVDVKSLHAKICELTLENDFFVRRARPGRMAGQHLCRAALAEGKIRGGVSCAPAAASPRPGSRSAAIQASATARGRIRRQAGIHPIRPISASRCQSLQRRNQGGDPLGTSPMLFRRTEPALRRKWHDVIIGNNDLVPHPGEARHDRRRTHCFQSFSVIQARQGDLIDEESLLADRRPDGAPEAVLSHEPWQAPR